jgi:hypothetical protein
MNFILYAILVYLLYQFIFNLVIPVYRTTRKIKKGFREMHERMSHGAAQPEQYQQQKSYSPSSSTTGPAPKSDYIDFEEIK